MLLGDYHWDLLVTCEMRHCGYVKQKRVNISLARMDRIYRVMGGQLSQIAPKDGKRRRRTAERDGRKTWIGCVRFLG